MNEHTPMGMPKQMRLRTLLMILGGMAAATIGLAHLTRPDDLPRHRAALEQLRAERDAYAVEIRQTWELHRDNLRRSTPQGQVPRSDIDVDTVIANSQRSTMESFDRRIAEEESEIRRLEGAR